MEVNVLLIMHNGKYFSYLNGYSWFSHDITKIQTKKLSLLLSFYFHVVLQHLITYIQTNFRFKRVLRFVIQTLEFPGFCVTWHLADSKESSYVGWKHYRFWEILISKHSLSQSKYYFNRYRFLKQGIHALVGKLKNRCFCWFLVAIFVPLKGTQSCCLSIQSFINLGKTFFQVSHIRNIAQTWFLVRLFVHLSSFISQILDFLYQKVSIFIFDGVTMKTTNISSPDFSIDRTRWSVFIWFKDFPLAFDHR